MAERVAANVRRFRRAREWILQDLSDALGRVGRPIVLSGVGKIEQGERRVDVDDLVALALALEVSPLALMFDEPALAVDDEIQLTGQRSMPVPEALDWACDRAGMTWLIKISDASWSALQEILRQREARGDER